MLASLKLEAIGDDLRQTLRLWRNIADLAAPGLGDVVIGSTPSRAWVAWITGPDARYRWKREFLRGRKDYTDANGVGSRGVYVWYTLESGKVYEVQAPVTWKRDERYFCRVTDDGEIVGIEESEVPEWLSAALESTS